MTNTNAATDTELGLDEATEPTDRTIDLVETIKNNFADLQRALIDGLFEQLVKSTGRLNAEASVKAEEARELRQRHAEQAPRIAARQRVLSYEADKLISEGRDSEVPALRAEAAKATKDLGDLLTQADMCDRRVGELSKLQKERARKIFEESFPGIRAALVTVQQGMCNLLDGTWDDLLRFQHVAGLEGSAPSPGQPYERSLLTPGHKADLTARSRGPEGDLFNELVQWFGVRVR